jgi:3-deoxy-D-manno-octulosonate 8-phosphate phosphatase (KDO 8-P phosphatase)
MLQTFKHKIKLIATDFDGILTDGFVYYSSVSDEEYKRLSFKDIMGISIAIKNGYKVAIISGEKNQIIDKVARKFNLEDVHQGIRDKYSVLKILCEKYSLSEDEICYLGDDINDIEVLQHVGLPVSIPSANGKISKKVKNLYVTEADSGNGVFREVIDKLLED